jgi:FkbM family methyltransferase
MKKIFFGKYSIGEVLLVGYAWLFARRFLQPLNKLLFHLSLRGMGVFNYQTFRISGEHYLIHRLLPRLLEKVEQPIMFDVGANEGRFSADLLAVFPEASIFSFEPHGKTFERLSKRVGDRCRVFNCGLGESGGLMKLYDVGDHEGTEHASLYPEVISDLRRRTVDAVDVEIKVLDEVVVELGLERIDFLKIDTEGHELSVLKGTKQLLAESRIGIIHFEFNDMNVVSGCFMRDFRTVLAGYRFFRLLPNALLELFREPVLSEIFGFQNIIAIREDHEWLRYRGI